MSARIALTLTRMLGPASRGAARVTFEDDCVTEAARELRALLAVARLAIHARDNIAQVSRVLRGHGCSMGDDLNGEARALENIVDGLDRTLSRLRAPAKGRK